MTQTNRPVRRSAPPRPAPAQRRPAQPNRRPAPAPRRGGFLEDYIPRGFWPLLAVGVAMILGSVALQYLLPDGLRLRPETGRETPVSAEVSEIHSAGPLRLNEIMTANAGALMDGTGNTPDWVEVANVSDRAVSLKGYLLARNAKAGSVFQFPDLTLEPGGFALVYCDGELQQQAGAEFHAPFRLSSGGDVLMLFNEAKVAVDTVNIPALNANSALIRVERDDWEVTDQPTPGLANTPANYAAMHTLAGNSPVRLAEIVASNTRFRPDESGAFQDYIVLSNGSGAAVDLSGWFLSDDPTVGRKWRFPQGAGIGAGEKLLVYASGQDRTDDPRHLHTNFRLSSEGETVTLSDASGRPMDQVTYDLLKTDTAYVRDANGNWDLSAPTE